MEGRERLASRRYRFVAFRPALCGLRHDIAGLARHWPQEGELSSSTASRLVLARVMHTPYSERPEPTGIPRSHMDARERWRIDFGRSTLEFSIGHSVLREIRGRFHCWGGLLLVDKADLRRSAIRIWVDMSSIDTGSTERDEFILATEPFDVHWEPALVFDSERVEIGGVGRGIVVGRVALHGFSREIAVAVEAKAPQPDERGAWHVVYTARASIDRGALGLRRNRYITDWLGEGVVGEAIEIVAHVDAVREDRPAADPPTPTAKARSTTRGLRLP
jgi:polyisoprenoid-binding protein YceI